MVQAVRRSRVPGWVQTCRCYPQLDCKLNLPSIILNKNLTGPFIVSRKAASWTGPPCSLNFAFVSSISIDPVNHRFCSGIFLQSLIRVPYLPASLLACKQRRISALRTESEENQCLFLEHVKPCRPGSTPTALFSRRNTNNILVYQPRWSVSLIHLSRL